VEHARPDDPLSGPQPRKRILFLSQCLPYPPFSGVTRRTFNIIEQLAVGFDVTLLAFYRRNHQPSQTEVDEARDALDDVAAHVLEPVQITSERTRFHYVSNHLLSLLLRRPYTYYEYRSPRFGRQLGTQLANERPDLVHIDSMDLFRWMNRVGETPIACTHHSIESELLDLRADRLRNPLSRAYVRWQARLLEDVEKKYAPRANVNLMMSALDATRLKTIAPSSRTAVVPNGVDAEFFSPTAEQTSETKEIVFMGPLYMYPNLDAIQYFVRECWPEVRRRHPDAHLTLIGRASETQAAALGAVDGVTVRGFVEDVRPFMERARCCIAPLRIGGGTRLKILEYWAMAKPVVSTTIGCEGLEAKDGDNIYIRDEPAGISEAVTALLDNPEAARSMGSAARATVQALYTWDRIGENLRVLYRELM
jgi:glycosyltransferase involved in cell wall biosynthesis